MNEKTEKALKGLTTAQVQKLTKEGKANRFQDNSQKSIAAIILTHVLDLPNLIILGAVVLLVLYGAADDSILISLVIFTNFLVAVFQEVQARRALKRITLVEKLPVTLLRDGVEAEFAPEEIVEGDVVKLAAGSAVVVDGELLQVENLLIDESALTGESDYKRKELGDEALSGTFVISGTGYFTATKVGKESYANKITAQARKFKFVISPLQRNVNAVVKLLTGLAIAGVLVLLSLNVTVLKLPEQELLTNIVTIVSSMIPQGLIITLTLTMILGVIKMYNQRILVQRASAVETLAGIKVLCMDKTGTITQNKLKMSNSELLTPLGIQLAYAALNAQKDKNKTGKVIEGFLTSQLAKENLAVGKQGVGQEAAGEVTAEVLFNSRNKYSGSVVSLAGKSYQVVFGGVDVLATLVRQDELAELQGYDAQYADFGQRNLCMLFREVQGSEQQPAQDQQSDGGAEDWIGAALETAAQNSCSGSFNVGGFFSITDQLRKGAKKILESFQAQNIKPVIISGDGPSTLAAIIKNLGVKGMNKIVTGSEIAAIDPSHESELAELIIGADVFARVTAEQKLTIVRAYQKHIGRAAMVGDGVNDALALKEADLGVSLGSGVNIAKNVADVVLLDDDLIKLSGVITEGRGIIYDMLRSSQILLIKNVYALVMILFSLALFLPFPFNFRGLFMLSLVNNNIPILFILLSRGNHGGKRYNYMHELVTFALAGGLVSGVMGLGALILLTPVMEVPELQSFILSFFVAVGIINSMIVFNRSYNPLKVLFGSWYFLAAIFNMFVYLVLLVLPFAIDIFQIKMPTLDSWLLIGLMSIGYLLAFAVLGPLVRGFAPLRKYLLSLGE